MRKLIGLFTLCFMLIVAGCTNLDDVLDTFSKTLTSLTGVTTKSIRLSGVNVQGVQFNNYVLEAKADTTGNYVKVDLEVKGEVVNQRNSKLKVEIQVPIYNNSAKIIDLKSVAFIVNPKSSQNIEKRWTETYEGIVQLNHSGALTTIYENGQFIGDSEGNNRGTQKQQHKPAKPIVKKQVKAKSNNVKLERANTSVQKQVESKPIEPAKQVRQQRRSR